MNLLPKPIRTNLHLVWTILVLLCPPLYTAAQPLLSGHSHNDYLQNNPLTDALQLGFASIEIDVFSVGDAVRVSHIGTRLKRKPLLTELYLQPLSEWIDRNGGRVFPDSDVQLVLMIDLKSDKQRLIPMLAEVLLPYLHMIDRDGDPQTVTAPVMILLSGGPGVQQVREATPGIFFIDGGFGQLSELDPDLMPRVSASYKSHFKWKGRREMPEKELTELKTLVEKAHLSGRKIRFWNTPDRPNLWETLLDAGVDWINVDDLEGFRKFIDQRRSSEH